MSTDVGDEVAALRAQVDGLEADLARARQVVDAMLEPVALLDPVRDGAGRIVDFTFVDANEAAAAGFLIPASALLGERLSARAPDEMEPWIFDQYVRVVEGGEPLALDGVQLPDVVRGRQLTNYEIRAARVGRYLMMTWRDVTWRYAAEEALAQSERHFRMLAENILDVIVRVRGGAISWVSGSVGQSLGWAPEDLVGRDVSSLVHPDEVSLHEALGAALRRGDARTLRCRVLANDGTFHWVECRAKPYLGTDGRPDGAIGTLHVVDAEVAALVELERRARFDDLTGVLKREEAIRRLEHMDRPVRQPGTECGVLFIDLDDFKRVNDTWGHAAGDTVLRTVSTRIRGLLRGGDTVARMGGDEFLVILEGLHHVDETVAVAEKIRTATAQPIPLPDPVVVVTATVGATLRQQGESADTVIARADSAMYRGKEGGRDHVVVIPPG